MMDVTPQLLSTDASNGAVPSQPIHGIGASAAAPNQPKAQAFAGRSMERGSSATVCRRLFVHRWQSRPSDESPLAGALLDRLGLARNPKKGCWEPTQVLVHHSSGTLLLTRVAQRREHEIVLERERAGQNDSAATAGPAVVEGRANAEQRTTHLQAGGDGVLACGQQQLRLGFGAHDLETARGTTRTACRTSPSRS